MNSIDLKFTAIPLIFLILRIWTLILSVMYDYVQVNDKHVPEPVKITLLYLSVSIYIINASTCTVHVGVEKQS